jgi:hypothetical protein
MQNVETGEGHKPQQTTVQRRRERNLAEFKGVDIFVPKDNEDSYLTKHKMDLRRLENGAILCGATREVPDQVDAWVDFIFPSGSYREKNLGAFHYMEHMINHTPYNASFSAPDASFRATTDWDKMSIKIQGVANLEDRNYGALPIIDLTLREISGPLDPPEGLFDSEREVIIGEVRKRDADPELKTDFAFDEIIYRKDNPRRYSIIGKEDDILSLTEEDVLSQHEVVFVPRGSTVQVFSAGERETTKSILDRTEEVFNQMKDNREPQTVDEELEGLLNPDFEQGRTYIKDLGLNDRMVNIQYLWAIPDIEYSLDSLAIDRMIPLAARKLVKVVRKGYGYGDGITLVDTRLGSEKKLIGLKFRVAKEKIQEGFPDSYSKEAGSNISEEEHHDNYRIFAENFYTEHVKKEVLGTLDNEDIKYIKDLSRKGKLVPTTIDSRLDWTLRGLRKYGRIIDVDKVTNARTSISTPEDIQRSMNTLSSNKPAILIVGDVGLTPDKSKLVSKQ